MEAITLGPLVLPLSRLPGLIALIILLVGSELLNKRYSGLARWAWLTALVATLGSRLIYATSTPSAYLSEPWTLLYFWQPGFSVWGAILSAVIFTGLYLYKKPQLLPSSLTTLGIASIVGLALLLLTPGNDFTRESLPTQTFTNLEGDELALTQFQGKPLVVNMWATWCPPCRREMPMLQSFEGDDRVQLIMINQGESPVAVDQFLRSQNLSFSQVLIDVHQKAGRIFRAPGLPATVFYNAQGIQVDRHFGELSRAQIERFIQQQASLLDK
ncbi:TlpA disulfide reductase family protein [Marinospirillum insulare]|uniref:Thiol:disulfide interchange protein n=1 Tax=Marinospirillum insulare TaxID=217169 RepID=A0ABQ6A1Q2_9GAMM|nr:TlpA disulfide reductase family protein [Marinospirillum insulare]GLR64034.1 thiol:disulfide interchange protein [Marinospirillum insulare]